MQPQNRTHLLAQLPPPWPKDVLPEIQETLKQSGRTLVVLDDDPTGIQTVYDVPVLTTWDLSALEKEFERGPDLFFILTNSRSLTPANAREIALEIGENLTKAAQKTGRPFSVISRSDSTLRGHYPGEVNALTEALGREDAIHLIIPFFEEGGRYTLFDVHWVEEGDQLIPVGETPFAKDASFGFTSSDLREWVEEKTEGRIKSSAVHAISLKDIRTGGPDCVKDKLKVLKAGSVCIINALTMRDLEVVTLGCLKAEVSGKSFLYRTGASFVRSYAGLPARPLLTREALALPATGAGLVIVGSHVPMSTLQLNHLKNHAPVNCVELDVNALLHVALQQGEIIRAIEDIREGFRRGEDTVLYTSRALVVGKTSEESLSIAGIVSTCLVEVVKNLDVRPRYIIAKGGITSSDVATRGLGVKRAIVLGQILPGVPVNRIGDESRFPGLAYIVFPGNVGNESALTNVVQSLSLK